MASQKNRFESSRSGEYSRIPRTAKLIDTMISAVLSGIGLYHLTQPNQAWRSGITELFCTVLLLTAAHRVSPRKASVMNLVVAVPICSLGIRHVIHGGGWVSGIAQLLFAVLLVVAAIMIHRDSDN